MQRPLKAVPTPLSHIRVRLDPSNLSLTSSPKIVVTLTTRPPPMVPPPAAAHMKVTTNVWTLVLYAKHHAHMIPVVDTETAL